MTAVSSLWAQRVAKLEESGESCKRYARRIGVNTLAGWRWKLRRNKAAEQPGVTSREGELSFVEVTQQLLVDHVLTAVGPSLHRGWSHF